MNCRIQEHTSTQIQAQEYKASQIQSGVLGNWNKATDWDACYIYLINVRGRLYTTLRVSFSMDHSTHTLWTLLETLSTDEQKVGLHLWADSFSGPVYKHEDRNFPVVLTNLNKSPCSRSHSIHLCALIHSTITHQSLCSNLLVTTLVKAADKSVALRMINLPIIFSLAIILCIQL